jgi:hypothetical protein
MVMRAMLETIEAELPRGAVVQSVTVSAEVPEGTIAPGLLEIQKANPAIAIGSYPFYTDKGPGAQLVTRGRDGEAVERVAQAIEALVKQLGGVPVRV